MTVRSVYEDQSDIIDAIISLHAPDGFDCDLTYGNGKFWDGREKPRLCFDIDESLPGVTFGNSTDIQQPDCSVGNVMFDPPFLTYVRAGRNGNGSMAMARRFGGYWAYGELEEHYKKTLDECRRVMTPGSILAFKCQDIIHNHRMHCTHANVISWASDRGFWLKDIFILAAKHRMPGPNRSGKQKHARIFHSYFLVFCRNTKRQDARQ